MTFPYGFIDKAQTLGLLDELESHLLCCRKGGAIAQRARIAVLPKLPLLGTSEPPPLSILRPRRFSESSRVARFLEATSNYALDADNLTEDGQVLLGGLTFSYNAMSTS